jgi:hypothetical protein
MNRRELIACFGGVALLPITAQAQEAGRIYRLGLLIPAHAGVHRALFR